MTVINESRTAKGYTPASSVRAAFGRARTIESITIHHWGVFGQTHDGVVNFFVNGAGTTSAHFVVSGGRIDCLVNPLDAAWHSGNGVGNATSIGIECRPEASPQDYETTAELIRFLRDNFGANLPLIPHRNWSATACPGIWDLDKLNRLAGSAAMSINTQSSNIAAATPQENPEVTPAQMQELKTFFQNEINKSINAMWATEGVTQALIQKVAEGLNGIKAGAVDVEAVAKAVNDDAAKRMQK